MKGIKRNVLVNSFMLWAKRKDMTLSTLSRSGVALTLTTLMSPLECHGQDASLSLISLGAGPRGKGLPVAYTGHQHPPITVSLSGTSCW